MNHGTTIMDRALDAANAARPSQIRSAIERDLRSFRPEWTEQTAALWLVGLGYAACDINRHCAAVIKSILADEALS